jgi:hypothetical protein
LARLADGAQQLSAAVPPVELPLRVELFVQTSRFSDGTRRITQITDVAGTQRFQTVAEIS